MGSLHTALGASGRVASVAVVALLLWLVCRSAAAQTSAQLNQYRAAETPLDGFQLSSGRSLGHLAYSLQLHLDYAKNPLVFEATSGMSESEEVALVSDQLTAHLGAAFGFYDAVTVFVALPLHLVMEGEALGSQPTATGFGAGDFGFGARVSLYQGESGAAALQATVTAPTGEGGDNAPGVAGDAGPTGQLEALGTLCAGGLRILLNAGARWREDTEFSGERFVDVLTFGAGLGVPLLEEALEPRLELVGESPLDDIGERAGSPLAAMLGLTFEALPGLRFGAAGGMGLLRGYGSPDARAVVTASYATPNSTHEPRPETTPETAPQAEAEPTVDASTTTDTTVASAPPIATAAPAVSDRDGDGIPDVEDRCPRVPGQPARDGCSEHLRYDPEAGHIELLRRIRFQGNTAKPARNNDAGLDELKAFLAANADLSVRVEAHMLGSSRRERHPLLLTSVERARWVASELLAAGVARTRLEAYGCGMNRPLVPPRHRDRMKNDRVELYVTRPVPKAGPRSTLSCMQASLEPERATVPQAVQPAAEATPTPIPATPAPPPKAAPTPVPTLAAGSAETTAQVLAALASDPKGDRDGDQVPNGSDACPLSPGSRSDKGCPGSHRVDLEAGVIVMDKDIRFEGDSAKLHRRSARHLREVARTLAANPNMKLLLVAHVAEPDPGSPDSLSLTQKRAAAVRALLIAQDVAASRLSAYGCGHEQPIAPNNVPWGRKKNERVELRLLDPRPASGIPSLEGCTASE